MKSVAVSQSKRRPFLNSAKNLKREYFKVNVFLEL